MTQTKAAITWPGAEVRDDHLRSIAQFLVRDQGWSYSYRGSHPRLYSPDGEKIVVFAATASDWRARLNAVASLKRAGARLDELPRGTVTPSREGADMAFPTIEAPWTDSEWRAMQAESDHWWRRLYAAERTAEEPEQPPEPSPHLTAMVERITRPRTRDDAKGAGPLSEARQMVRDGYSVDHVIRQTGWGRTWLADLAE